MRSMLLAALLCALSACASTSIQYVPLPDPAVAVSNPALTRIYLLRPGPGLGGHWPVDVYSDQNRIGRLEEGGYLCYERKPGPRVARLVTVKSGNDGLGAKERVLDASLEPGETVYARISIDRETWRPAVELLNPEQGRSVLSGLTPPAVEQGPAPEQR